jgi:hypothetical protein
MAKAARAAKNTKAPAKKAAPVSAPAETPTITETSPSSTRNLRAARQAQLAKQRRQQNLLIYGGIGAFILLIGIVVFINIRNSRPVVGEEILTSQGNIHIDMGTSSPIAYNSIPPTSGPHYGNLAAWNIYREPQRYELLNHNLEDGGVVVYYQCPEGCPEVVDQLTAIIEPYINEGRHLVLAPNDPTWTIGNGAPLHQDMGARIALTAWTRILKMDEVDEETIRTFIERYEGIDHHVPGIG